MQLTLWDDRFSNYDLSNFQTFEKKVKTGKGDAVEVYKCTIESARLILSNIIKRTDAKHIIADDSVLVKNILEGLKENSINIHFFGDKKVANIADIGISEAEFAIAESGTLVEHSYSIWKRLVSAMPNVHIALVKSNRIVKDFESAFEILKTHIVDASHISFITGPSITADIERVLTIGVHGPGKLVVIFIQESDNE
ncbi:MAG: lactate utilization protein C [Desulfurella sp.]|jgi:L-lactate dehydrogenase complex protein LldG